MFIYLFIFTFYLCARACTGLQRPEVSDSSGAGVEFQGASDLFRHAVVYRHMQIGKTQRNIK